MPRSEIERIAKEFDRLLDKYNRLGIGLPINIDDLDFDDPFCRELYEVVEGTHFLINRRRSKR